MNPTSRSRRLALVGGVLLLSTLTVASCGGGSGTSDSTRSLAGTADAAAPAKEAAGDDASVVGPGATSKAAGGQIVAAERAVISTGNVSLRSQDVRGTLFEVQKVVDRVRGQVTERNSETEDDGTVRSARLVLRVPSASFADTMAALEEAGALISSDSSSKDVTTQVIDTDVRVQVQQRSIDRIKLLFDRAQSIQDIVAVEAQLSQREADLGSLQQQQAYLSDQTSLSTITVSVERAPRVAAPEKDDKTGFLAGLAAGWDALSGVALRLSTALGALVPWLVLALVLAVPGVALTRRLRRRTPATPGPSATT